MPTVRVETTKIAENTRIKMADAIYNVMKSQFGDRVIDVYISEYQLFTRKGSVPDAPSALVELIAALIIPKDDMALLALNLDKVIRECMGEPDMNVTLSYVRRDQDHLAVNGELLSDLYKRLSKK